MWPFTRKTARQREIRRSLLGRTIPWWRLLITITNWRAVGFTVVGVTGAAVILNAGGEVLLQRENEILIRPVVARVDVSLADPGRTDAKRAEARQATPGHYALDHSLLDMIRARLMNGVNAARAVVADPNVLREEAAKSNVFLTDEALAEIQRLTSQADGELQLQVFDPVIDALVSTPLIEVSAQSRRPQAAEAALFDPREPGRVRYVPIIEHAGERSLRFANNPEDVRHVAATAALVMSPPLRSGVEGLILTVLRAETEGAPAKPIYRFDAERTAQAARAAAAAVPEQVLTFPKDTILVEAGPIDALEYNRLEEEHRAYLAMKAASGALGLLQERGAAGRSALALLVVAGLLSYIAYQRPALGTLWQQMLALALVLAVLGAGRLAFVSSSAPPTLSFGFQALAAAVLTVVFPRGPVFAGCAALAALLTLALRQETPFLICLTAVSGPFVMLLRDVRKRGTIVGVGLIAATLAFLTVCAVGLTNQQSFLFAVNDALWAAGATLLAAFVVEGLLSPLERIFAATTSMTLLEWCDSSRPVLRRMAAEAPGTYNHSLLVGNLAQAAAEAIGAHGLLCRAGALFHDIGKINKPEYFVENQSPGVSRHEKLSPAMSLLIIVGHVKDGVEMAKEYGLPHSLRPFIAEHHGTTIVEYFYHAANKLRKPGDPDVAEAQFRYPGPKPQSRESAIVMLCDGVEGAVRAMTEPTPARIEAIVSEIVQKRLLDGQLDECDLTFRELATVEKSLVRSLCALYHARIAYPESERKGEPRAESENDAARLGAEARTAREDKLAEGATGTREKIGSRP